MIGVVYPVYAILMGKKDRAFLLKYPDKKVYTYKFTSWIQVILAFMIFIGLIYHEGNLSDLGLSFLKNALWAMLLITCIFTGYFLMQKINLTEKKEEELKLQFEAISYVLPTTLREFKWAILMSVIVGVLEELIFRGFLFWQINQHLPIIPSILIVNIIFGLCHYGTGPKNAITAFALGVIWSALYYLTDSLWLPILGHVLMDMYSSTLAKKIFIDNNLRKKVH